MFSCLSTNQNIDLLNDSNNSENEPNIQKKLDELRKKKKKKNDKRVPLLTCLVNQYVEEVFLVEMDVFLERYVPGGMIGEPPIRNAVLKWLRNNCFFWITQVIIKWVEE